MKLLIVTPYFYPQIGGLENYAYNIAKGLKKTFHWDIVVVTSNHVEKKDIKENLEGMTIYRLTPLFKLSNTPINPFWYFNIKEIIKYEKPDIIIAHSPVPFIADIAAMGSKKIPFVLTYHAGSMKKGHLLVDMLIGIYETYFLSKLLKKASIVICSSRFVQNSLVNIYNPHNFVITPAVDTLIFKPARQKKENIILFVGRHANVYKLKGLKYLLEAIRHLSNVKLHVIGEKINITQKNVKFLGIKAGKDLALEMQKSSVFVLPSIAPMESFGMVLIEAMACGIPVIGTSMGGISEIINHGKNGLLVPPKNAIALKNAISMILNNISIGNSIGNNGFEDVKKFYLWKDKVKETNKLLLELIN